MTATLAATSIDTYLFIVYKGSCFQQIHEHVNTLKGFYNGAGWCIEKRYAEAVSHLCQNAELQYLELPLVGESFQQFRNKHKISYYRVKTIQIELEMRQLKEHLKIDDRADPPFDALPAALQLPQWQKLRELQTEYDLLQRCLTQQLQEEKLSTLQLQTPADFHNLLQPLSEQQLIAELQETSAGVPTGYKVGTTDLILPGGSISIVAGPTSHGKTALLINFVLGALTQWQQQASNQSVYFFSYEESRAAIASLFLNTYIGQELSHNNRASIRSYFREHDMRYLCSEKQARQIFPIKKEAFFQQLLDPGRLHICYADFSAEQLVAAIRFLKKNSSVGLICIDYMQLLRYGTGTFSSRQEELKQVCLLLKDCAVETGLPILLAAQFNRSVVTEADLSPTNIGEAGDIERIANLIIGFWNRNFDGFSREGNRNKQGVRIAKESTIYLEILKGREIGIGGAEVFDFDGNTGRLTAKAIIKQLKF